MFQFLKHLFSPHDRLPRLARGQDRRTFIQNLSKTDVIISTAIHGVGLDPLQITPESYLACVEESLAALKQHEQETQSYTVFTYNRYGQRCLPFFSSIENAECFFSEFCKENNRFFVFIALMVPGEVLAQCLAACEAMVLDDRCNDEYELSPADLRLLQEHSAASGPVTEYLGNAGKESPMPLSIKVVSPEKLNPTAITPLPSDL